MDDPSVMPARLATFLAASEPNATDIEVTGYEAMTGGYSRLLARGARRDVEARLLARSSRRRLSCGATRRPDRSLIHTDRA